MRLQRQVEKRKSVGRYKDRRVSVEDRRMNVEDKIEERTEWIYEDEN